MTGFEPLVLWFRQPTAASKVWILISSVSREQARILFLGREPWSSGYGRRLMFQRLGSNPGAVYWMYIYFSHIFVVRIVMFVRKDENKRKRGRGWPIFLKKEFYFCKSNFGFSSFPYRWLGAGDLNDMCLMLLCKVLSTAKYVTSGIFKQVK